MSSDSLHSSTSKSARRRLDLFGIGIAGLCAAHCLATIIIVSGLGIGGHFLLAPEIHEFGLALAVFVAAVAIGWGAVRHRRPVPFVIAMMGLSFMGGAFAMAHGTGEAVLTIIGVALVSIGHILNLRAAR